MVICISSKITEIRGSHLYFILTSGQWSNFRPIFVKFMDFCLKFCEILGIAVFYCYEQNYSLPKILIYSFKHDNYRLNRKQILSMHMAFLTCICILIIDSRKPLAKQEDQIKPRMLWVNMSLDVVDMPDKAEQLWLRSAAYEACCPPLKYLLNVPLGNKTTTMNLHCHLYCLCSTRQLDWQPARLMKTGKI